MEERNNSAPARRRRPVGKAAQKPGQEVHYTQPRPFYRNRLIVQLLSVAAVVLAVTVGVSIFFKVDTVVVTGASKYSAATIVEASSIEKGDSLLFFGRAGAAIRIKKSLPYVDTVRFQLQLPGTVNIIVEEKTVAYAVQATDGSWWMMTSDGMIAEKATALAAETGPTVEGVILQDPVVGKAAAAAEPAAEDGIATAADRLKAAVHILAQLETWELFAPATRIDVTDLFALRLYCGPDYRVELGDSGDLEEKIGILKYALPQLDGRGGVLKLQNNEETGEWEVLYQSWAQQ